MDSTSDNALMLKVKAGDLDKLGLLFERYNRRLFRFFYRMTLQQQLSEDLVQAVFERILKYRHTYASDGEFTPWIYQISRNIRVDHYRQEKHSPKTDDFVDVAGLMGDDGNDAVFESESDRDLRFLQQAIDKLDPLKKETLVLSRFQGFKYKEIAEIMDCTESAVKVRIFRAMNELKDSITELKNAAL